MFFLVIGFFKVPYYWITIVLFSIYILYVFIVWLEERKKETTIGKSNNANEAMTHPSDMMDSNALITQEMENSINHQPKQSALTSKLSLDGNIKITEPLIAEDLEEREKVQGNYKIVLTQASQREIPDTPSGEDHNQNHLDIPFYEEDHEARVEYRHRKSSIVLEGSVMQK